VVAYAGGKPAIGGVTSPAELFSEANIGQIFAAAQVRAAPPAR